MCPPAIRAAVAALAVLLCSAPAVAQADPGHAVVTPTTGKLVGEGWAQIYSLPVSENPTQGNGDPCLEVGNKVIQEIGGLCTVEQGTAFTTSFGTACSDFEEESFGADEAEQRACALASDSTILGIELTVDGEPSIDIHRRKFEVFSPQRTVELPEDNIFGVAPRTATLTAHAWGVVVRNLSVGRHVVTLHVTFPDGSESFPHVIDVVPRG
jgi:hypothetical protein